jgi:hypothetical protein
LKRTENPCVPSWSDGEVGTEAPFSGVRFWEAPQHKRAGLDDRPFV